MDHPKMLKAGRDARDLWLASVTWCSKHRTDGLFPPEALPALASMAFGADSKSLANCQDFARRLLEVCLWEFDGSNYTVHDYLDYNPSKADLEATSAARKEAGRAGGMAKADNSLAKASKTPSKTLANGWQNSSKSVAPSPSPSPFITTTTTAQASLESYVSAGLIDFSNNITLISSGPQSEEVCDRLTELYEHKLFDWWSLAIKAAQDNNGRTWAYVRKTVDNSLKLGTPPGAPKPQVTRSNGHGPEPVKREHNRPATAEDMAEYDGPSSITPSR